MVKRNKHLLNGFIAALFIMILFFFGFNSLNATPQTNQAYYFLFFDPEWPFENSLDATHRLTPLCELISNTLGKTISPLYIRKETDLEKYLERNNIIMGILNSNTFFKNRKSFDLGPILIPIKENTKEQKKCIAILPNNKKINDIKELQGKILAVCSINRPNLFKQLSAFPGYPKLAPESFFRSIIETITPQSAIMTVLLGQADCAYIPENSLQVLKKSFPGSDCNVSNFTVLEPKIRMTHSPVISIKNRLTDEEINQLNLALREESLKKENALKPLSIESFNEINELEFIRLNSMFYRLKQNESVSSSLLFHETYDDIRQGLCIEVTLKKSDGSGPRLFVNYSVNGGRKQKIEMEHSEECSYHAFIPLSEISPKLKEYRIQEGDSLWRIARSLMLKGKLHRILVEKNEIKNPDQISQKEKLKIPYFRIKYNISSHEDEKARKPLLRREITPPICYKILDRKEK
ncbi:MAG: PhnD/SsuA/transferrin family substrate-binding protein [Candidatus Omnitrophota bacterium]